MPLPRVAYVSSGAARPPAASNGYDPTQAAKLTRNMRGDPTKGDMGSLLFPEQPNQVSRMPVPASNVALHGTSVDHPLRVAGVVAVDGGTTGLEVQFGAFLAVILGLFIPVVFLVTLFIQSESRKAAESGSEGDKF